AWKVPNFGSVSQYSVFRVLGSTVAPSSVKVLVGGAPVPSSVTTIVDNEELPNGVQFTYFVTATFTDGGASGASNFATVAAVDAAPVAVADTFSTPAVTPLTANVLANDTDVDSPPAQLVATAVSQPLHGTLTLNPDGSFVYTPASGYLGPDSFTYRVSNGLWGSTALPLSTTSNVATVSISVHGNTRPVASAQDVVAVEDSPAVFALSASDAETPTADLTATITQAPAHGTLNGTWPNYSYTPALNFNGPDSFQFTVTDRGRPDNCAGGLPACAPALTSLAATVSINVTAVNDAPGFIAGNDQVVLDDDGPQTIVAWATSLSAGPPDESLQVLDFLVTTDNDGLFAESGLPSIAPDGTLTFTPALDADGTATVSVTLHDSGAFGSPNINTSAPQTFLITVTPSNQEPTTSDDDFRSVDMSNLDASLFLNRNPDVAEPLVPEVIWVGDQQTLRLVNGDPGSRSSAFTTQPSSIVRFSTTFQFRVSNPGGGTDPYFGELGADGFTFALQASVDGFNALGGSGGGLGYLGIANSVAVEFDTYYNSEVSDLDSNHLAVNVGGSVVSVATVAIPQHFESVDLWTAWIDYDGTTLEIRLSPTGSRPLLPTLSHVINIPHELGDNNEAFIGFTAATGAATNTVDVMNWTFTTPIGEDQSINLLTNDDDPDMDALTVEVETAPEHGTVVVHADGTFTYTPVSGYEGTDSFTYTIDDGHGHTATGTVHITVTGPPTG
ncbi:MAG: Ig-like domain-containing protein, partial [Vicinamibacterales bacterium]